MPFLQLALPEGSGFSGRCLAYSSGSLSVSSLIGGFYIPSQSQAKSPPSSPPLLWASCAAPPPHPRSPLSRSQRNHGRLDLSIYFAPKECTANVDAVICESSINSCSSIVFLTVSPFLLARQPISPPHLHALPNVLLPLPNHKQIETFPSL